MIKSAKKEKYYGTLAYADGEVRKVVEYTKEVVENADGIKHNEYWNLKGYGYVSKIVSVEAYKIMTALDTVTAVVKVDGRTYIGHAQCNPSDDFDGAFGRQLALARAMHDHAKIKELELYSNWNSRNDLQIPMCFQNDVDGDANGDNDDTLHCCHCGKPVDADGLVPDDYTDDYYCSEECYYNAGGNIDPDGDDDDDGDNLCDYCLGQIVVPIYDADGHEYCCEECRQKALEEDDED